MRRSARFNPKRKNCVCSAHRRRVGSNRRRNLARHVVVRNVLRSLLHWTGRATSGPDQRAALSADAANSGSEFCRSLQRSESFRARIYDSDDAGRARQNLKLPYAQDWNLNLQRSFGANWLLEAGYVGTKGTKLPRFIESNPTTFEPGDTSQTPADRRRLFSGCTRTDTNPCTFLLSAKLPETQIPSTTRSKLVEKTFQPRAFFPRFVHTCKKYRRRFVVQHYRFRFAKHRGRKRFGAKSVRPRQGTRPFDVRRASSLRAELSVESSVRRKRRRLEAPTNSRLAMLTASRLS